MKENTIITDVLIGLWITGIIPLLASAVLIGTVSSLLEVIF